MCKQKCEHKHEHKYLWPRASRVVRIGSNRGAHVVVGVVSWGGGGILTEAFSK